MEPVRPAQRLERLPEPHDEEEEDESDVSTEVESEVLSQQFRSLPWPFPAVSLSVGISPSASMRRGISPLASDQQTCMSASSLTAWSGAQVVYGGGTGTAWASGLGLNKFEKLRVSPRSGAAATNKGLTTTTAPTAAMRPITAMTTATTALATTVTSLQCELTAENLDRLRETRALLDELPVGPRKENTQRTKASPPAVIAVSRARSNCAAGAGGTRVSRAAALSKQQPLPTWQSGQRGVNYSGAHALADLQSRPPTTTTAAAETGALDGGTDGPREKQRTTAGATPTVTSTPPLAVAQCTRGQRVDEPLTLRAEREDDNDGRRGAAGEAGATPVTLPQRSSAATTLTGAPARAPRASCKGGSGRALAKRQHLSTSKTRYQGQILQLEDCTETEAPATVSSPSRERAPTVATPADATTAGTATSAAGDVSPAPRAPLASASVGSKKSSQASVSQEVTSGRGVQAARRIPVAGLATHNGTLSSSSTSPMGREVDQDGSEAVRRETQSSSAGLAKEENDQAASSIDDSLTSCSVHTISPENARQLVVRARGSLETHPVVHTSVSEKASCDRRRSDIRGVDEGEGEAVEREKSCEGLLCGAPPTLAPTHQGRSLLTSSSAVASSRPPLLSLTAIGVASATSGVFRSAMQTSPRLSAALPRITLPHQPQQLVSPAVLLSAGTTEAPPSRKPVTAVTVASPSSTGDWQMSVSQASRADPSRRSAARTGASKASSSCDTHIPSSVDCLPSVGSTQPPLSVRTPDGGGGLRWRLTTSSRTSSAGASDQRVHGGHPRSTDSVSSDSTPPMLHEVWAPAAVADESGAMMPPSRSKLKLPESLLSLDGQARAARPNSDHLDRSDTAAASSSAATLIPAVLAPALMPGAGDRRSDNADKLQTRAPAPAAVALATPSPSGIGTSGDEKGKGSAVQAATRVRRAPAPGRKWSGEDRINLAGRRSLQPVLHGSATSTSPKESGMMACAVRDRPRALAPLDGRVRQPLSQATPAAGSGTNGVGLTARTEPAGLPGAAAAALHKCNAEQMPDMWQQTLSRAPPLADRRSTTVIVPSPGIDGAGDGLLAAAARECSGNILSRSHSLPTGALPSAGGSAAQPSTDPLPPEKGSARLDQGATRQPHHQPELLPRAAADGGLPHAESRGALDSPPTVYSDHLTSHALQPPAVHTAVGGEVHGQLSLPPSVRVAGDPACDVGKGRGHLPERLPALGLSSSRAAVNPARSSSPKDTDAIDGHGDPSRVPVARRTTVAAIRESPLARSRSGTSSNGSGSGTAGNQHPRHPQHHDRLIMPPGSATSSDSSQRDEVEEGPERPKCMQARKVPPPRRRRCADVGIPEEGEERKTP
ncbi:hypothetical protein LSCM1_07220 [Leishmania martiniquensis]|uniref:Uncharacterized protein n=1 Tax=Leishmania martiniquensis TaxID=1580590 RepID=A0A836HGK6_9TRYP|nr:hypothetical protein LSCM1_07220 [Leishmania martiniquensis]